MLILLRLIPFVAGALNTILLLVQARNAGAYPWFAVTATILLFVSAFLILWKRGRGMSDLRLAIPSVITIAVLGYALLLAEGVYALWIIPIVAGVLTLVCLELLFLSTFVSAWYPVNGLSHVNLALVPVTFWLTAFTSVGLTVFVNSSRIVPIVTMSVIGFAMFYWTTPAEAGPILRRRWSLIGLWIGFQLGIVGAVLPVNLAIHGAIAALIGAFVVRTRRYGFAPPIHRHAIVLETAMFIVFLAVVLMTARWV